MVLSEDKKVQYWLESAKHDLDVAESLFESAKYDWCLFVAHLVLEKTLKGCIVKKIQEYPPKTHDLVRLASIAQVGFDEDTLKFLDMANSFQISTRYPDEKFKFYKLCDRNFTVKNFQRIKEIYECLVKQINS